MIRLERSELAVPASSWRMIEKACGLDADVVFLDLEDSVAPAKKESARANVVRAFRDLDWGEKPRVYRVNALDTPFFYRDLIDVLEAVGDRVELVILPKAQRPEDVCVLETLLRQIELAQGIDRAIAIEAQIESAEGIINASRIARASTRLEALIFGPGDYAASVAMPSVAIGVDDEWDGAYGGDRWHFPKSTLLVAGRAAGLRVIDGPYANYEDIDGFRAACRRARALGFDGTWCIHPTQIPVANEVFSPTAAEVDWARSVIAAYQTATVAGHGAITVDGKMVDAASIRMAERVLNVSERGGTTETGKVT